MIDNKRKPKTAEPEAAQGLKFRDIKLKTAQRTFYIADDTWERLHQLYDAYPSRNNTYIIDAMLNEMLDKYLPKKRK